jgi:membrane protease YdiL (CAAX protease family)
MQYVARILWNGDERRVRALWRLAAQTIMCILIMLLLQYILALVIGLLSFATGSAEAWLFDLDAAEAAFRGWSRNLSDAPLFALRYVSTVACVWLAGRILDRRSFVDFGFHISKAWLADLCFGLILGGSLITLIFLVELAIGWVKITGTFVVRESGNDFATAILPAAVTMLFIGAEEELLSRGYQLTNLAEGFNCRHISPQWSVTIASLLSAAIFALMHAGNPHACAISTLGVFMGGLVIALGFVLTGELAIPMGLHVSWNFFQSNVFGFPVSGMDFSSATFIASQQHGPELWVGDAFGPEAGLLSLSAMVLGCLLIPLWVRLHYGQVRVHLFNSRVTKPRSRP